MKQIPVILISMLLSVAVFAQPNAEGSGQKQPEKKKSSGTLNNQFNQIQEEIDQPPNKKEVEKQQEQKTLLIVMQQALSRNYRLKDAEKIQASEISYENSEENDLIYYVKYREFVGQFRFTNSPKKYFSWPIQTKVLLKPGSKYDEAESIFKNEKGNTAADNKKTTPNNQ